jgi:hypothetical protein
VGELEHELVDHTILRDRSRDRPKHRVIRRRPDELAGIEAPHRLAARCPRQSRHVPHIRLLHHRPHRRINILLGELRRDVRVEHRSKINQTAPSKSSNHSDGKQRPRPSHIQQAAGTDDHDRRPRAGRRARTRIRSAELRADGAPWLLARTEVVSIERRDVIARDDTQHPASAVA